MRVIVAACLMVTVGSGQVPQGLLTAAGSAPGGVPTGAFCLTDASGAATSWNWTPTVTPLSGVFTANLLTPPCVVKHMSGLSLIADAGQFEAYGPTGVVLTTPLTTSFGNGALFVYSPLGYMAVKPDGNVWLTTATFPGQLTELTLTGQVVQTVNLPAPTSTFTGPNGQTSITADFIPKLIDSDSQGNVWVGGNDRVVRVSAGGVVSPLLTIPGNGVDTMDVDPSGRLWVLSQAGTSSATLYRVNAQSTITLTLPVPNTRTFDIDGCGRLHLLVAQGVSNAVVEVREGLSGAVVDTLQLGTPPSLLSPGLGLEPDLMLDTDGGFWVRNDALIDRFDRTGALTASLTDCASGGARANQLHAGDATGIHLASVIDRDSDADADGVANARELELGFDPFDSTSTPYQLTLVGQPLVGGTLSIAATIPPDAGLFYGIGASLGTDGIAVPPTFCPLVPLSNDAFFSFWLQLTTTTNLVSGAFGVLDATGSATMSVPLPGVSLGGVQLSFALLTLSGGDVATVTDALTVPLP